LREHDVQSLNREWLLTRVKHTETHALPRIGHEVIVSFLDGNSDQPIITGRTHHAANNQLIEAGTEIHHKAGGSFIKVDPSGVTLSGPMVNMNTGGALTEVYRDHIGQAGDSRIWTLERLHEATAHGCSKVSQQERWLRIALQIDTPILSEPTLRNLAVNAEMPAEDRLIAMERFVESEHATA